MKIRAPDDDGSVVEETKGSGEETKETFEDEIAEILKMPQIQPKFVVEGVDSNSPEYKLQVLRKFTGLCREEIIPRHAKALTAIQTKLDEMQRLMLVQQNDLEHVTSCRQELQENVERLETARRLARARHQDLSERLRDTMKKLQDSCRNKTMAERKMAADLVNLKRKAENLKVAFTDTSSKVNYYRTQVKAQTTAVKRHTKPLYLDKNRMVFIKGNLNSMRQNIEELIRRVKVLKVQLDSTSSNTDNTDLYSSPKTTDKINNIQ